MGVYERKQREKELRRTEIINAAKKVFSTKGFSSASIAEIAAEAELSSATVYLYFKSKRDLHTLISIGILKHLAVKLREVAEKNISVEAKIERFWNAFIYVYDSDPNLLINLFHLQSGESIKNLSNDVLEELKTCANKVQDALADVVKDGIRQKVIVNEPPLAIAGLLCAMFSGVVLWVHSKRMLNDQQDFVIPTLSTAFMVISRGLKIS